MKLPKEVKVGGHIYKIIFPYVFRERVDFLGQCDSDKNEIRIREIANGGVKIANSRIEEVFWHELLHAIDNTFSGENLDEDIIKRLASGLYQVLSDNGFLKEVG